MGGFLGGFWAQLKDKDIDGRNIYSVVIWGDCLGGFFIRIWDFLVWEDFGEGGPWVVNRV